MYLETSFIAWSSIRNKNVKNFPVSLYFSLLSRKAYSSIGTVKPKTNTQKRNEFKW
jgi:hypothetical protein